jgi:hypothetical protein
LAVPAHFGCSKITDFTDAENKTTKVVRHNMKHYTPIQRPLRRLEKLPNIYSYRKLGVPLALWFSAMITFPASVLAESPASDPPAVNLFSAPPSFQPPGEANGRGPHIASPWDVWDAVNGLSGQVAGGWGPGGVYADSRWSEDYSYLRNPALVSKVKPDFFDPLKFIPLDPAKNIYITFSGEARLKDYYENEANLGRTKPINQNRNILRTVLGADLHIGTAFRAYVELINAEDFAAQSYVRSGGNPVGAFQRERLDVQQAFVEGKAQILDAQTGIMVGRQDFEDGPSALIDTGNAVNVHTSWDGFRIYAMWPKFRIDTFDFAGVKLVSNSLFNDNTNYQARLMGVTTSYALPEFLAANKNSQLFFDTLYWDYATNPSTTTVATEEASNATQSGAGDREYWGARLWGNTGPINMDYLGVYQGGHQQVTNLNITRPVHAYAIMSQTDYKFTNEIPLSPTFGVQINYSSGGNVTKQSGSIGTFTSPLANPFYFGVVQYVILQNVFDIAPEARLHFSPRLSLYLQLPIIWRSSLKDDVYGNGLVYKTTIGSGRYVGLMPLALMSWAVNNHINLTEIVTGFAASQMMLDNGNHNSFQFLSNIDIRF